MSYPICCIKNISNEVKTLQGKTFEIDELYQIPDNERVSWGISDAVIDAIVSDTFKIYDAFGLPVITHSLQIDWLKNY